jgi:hypothetical protein
MAVAQRSSVVRLADAPPPGVAVLFSNLGTKSDAYDDAGGWLVEGPDNAITGASQAIANPYTPTTNATIQGIQIALGYDLSGTNAAAVAVFTDNGGLPGKPLKVWNVKNLPTFGTCCALVTVKDAAGIKLTAGTQYWIVAGTDAGSTTSYNVWAYTWNESQGPIAFVGTATNNVWTAYTGDVNAYAIYGIK